MVDRKQLTAEILARTSVSQVVGKYVKLTKSGRNYKGLCPFHNEATSSFVVSDEKGIYKCFGCGEGGDAVSFISKMEGISYFDAVANLANSLGLEGNIIRKFERTSARVSFDREYEILKFAKGFFHYYLMNTTEGKVALTYLTGRGLTLDIIEQFGIGFAPRDVSALVKAMESNGYSKELAMSVGLLNSNDEGESFYCPFRSRIMFPVANGFGNVVGFSARALLEGDEKYGKYINSPETKVFKKGQLVYNLDEAKKFVRNSGRVLLFEGFLDVIAAHRAGFPESIATMGTALTLDHVKILKQVTNRVVVCYDGDSSGIAAISKAIPLLLSGGITVDICVVPNGLDPDDYIKKNGVSAFSNLVENSVPSIEYYYEHLKQNLNLDFTADKAEFQSKVHEFSNHLPNENLKKFLIRKLNDDLYKPKATRDFGNFGASYRERNQRDFHFRNGIDTATSDRGGIFNTSNRPLNVEVGYIKAEKELIYYMIKSKKVFDIVNTEISCSFNIDSHRKIARAIEGYYFENEVMDFGLCFSGVDLDLLQIVNDIIREKSSLPNDLGKNEIYQLISSVQYGTKKLINASHKMKLDTTHNFDEKLAIIEEATKIAIDN